MTDTKPRRRPRTFGQIAKLPSKRHRARYFGPDGVLHSAPTTFDTREQADDWLAKERAAIVEGTWTPPAERHAAKYRPAGGTVTFADFADLWLRTRTNPRTGRPLAARTRGGYRAILDNHLIPEFGDRPLSKITEQHVAMWHLGLLPDAPTLRTHTYVLLRSILSTAVDRGLLTVNPAQVKGATTTPTVHRVEIATVRQVVTIAKSLPPEWALLPMLAAWVGLRFGEATELRRGDVDLTAGTLRVERGVVRVTPEERGMPNRQIGPTKSDAGYRVVHIPPHLIPEVENHLRDHVAPHTAALLFHAVRDEDANLSPSTFYDPHYYAARKAAGRPDLRFHDLRHTAGTMYMQQGATLKEAMELLGHSTPSAALRYQHAATARMRAMAERMSERAIGE